MKSRRKTKKEWKTAIAKVVSHRRKICSTARILHTHTSSEIIFFFFSSFFLSLSSIWNFASNAINSQALSASFCVRLLASFHQLTPMLGTCSPSLNFYSCKKQRLIKMTRKNWNPRIACLTCTRDSPPTKTINQEGKSNIFFSKIHPLLVVGHCGQFC